MKHQSPPVDTSRGGAARYVDRSEAKAKAKAVAKPGLKVGKAAKEPSGKRRRAG